jgi:hypothetical protein
LRHPDRHRFPKGKHEHVVPRVAAELDAELILSIETISIVLSHIKPAGKG